MRSRLWDEDATIVVSTAVFRAFIWGWAIRYRAMAFKDANMQNTAIRSRSAWGITRQAVAAAVLDAVRAGLIGPLAARLLLPHLTDAEFALEAGARRTEDAGRAAWLMPPPPYADVHGPPKDEALASSGVGGRAFGRRVSMAGGISRPPSNGPRFYLLARKSYSGFCCPHRCLWRPEARKESGH